MNVRQLREGQKLSQQQLASMTGIPKDRIAKWEQGKGMPKATDAKTLEKFFNDKVPATAPHAPQNGHENQPRQTLTRIGELVKEIQYYVNPKPTIEQIADQIKFSRPHLTTLTKNGHSNKAYTRLQKTYGDIIKKKKEELQSDKLTSSTRTPQFEMKSNGHPNEKDQTISLLVNNETKLIDTNKNQQETIGKLTDLVTKLVEKK